jgi:hypothetical protein
MEKVTQPETAKLVNAELSADRHIDDRLQL